MKRTYQDGCVGAQPTSPFHVGLVLEIRFPTFTPRITIRSERELTVEITAGDNIDFSDTVEYEAVAVRDDVVILLGRSTLEARSCTCLISVPATYTRQ